MKVICILSALGAWVSVAQAVTMKYYEPGNGVEPAFEFFLENLYAFAEDPTANTTFTDFFSLNGSLIVMSYYAQGAEEILALKQLLLPPSGEKQWNHMPNMTTVYSDTTTEKIYQVYGVIQSTYTGGNCSTTYYQSRFTVAKNASGYPGLIPHSGSLITYDDYVVTPSYSPTTIACTQ